VNGSSALDLRRFGSLLRARKWTIVVVTAAVLGTALLFSFRQTPIYVSQASVLVEVQPGENAPDGPNMATEKRVASSAAVAKLVLTRLHLPGEQPQALLRALSVDVPVDTEILDFSYSAPVPEVAQQRAELFAESYLDYRQQRLGDDVLATQRSLQDQIDILNKRQDALQKKAAAEANEITRRVLESQANLLYSQINNLYQKRAELVRAQEAPPGKILADAQVPRAPARPNHLVNGSLGLVLGLVLGLAAAILREHADDHLRGSADLETQVGMPVLGAIPPIAMRNGHPGGELVTIQQPDSAAAEAFRHLRVNFVVAAASRGAKTVLVTSASEGEGKTFTTANLGIVLAKSGCTVILISADMRRPRLEQVLGIPPARSGLADFLRDRVVLRDIQSDQPVAMWSVMHNVMHNLMVLPVGPTDGDPTDLLGSSDVTEFIQSLRNLADYVLIDAAPLLPAADAAALVPACDAVLMVANARSATRADVTDAHQQLEKMHATTLGAVLISARDGGPKRYPHRG
jgi:polysaccharide biosynthesis transport protein